MYVLGAWWGVQLKILCLESLHLKTQNVCLWYPLFSVHDLKVFAPVNDFLDFRCSLWQKKVPTKGILFITKDYACYYCSTPIITRTIISFQNITGIKKEATFGLIPNSVVVTTYEGSQKTETAVWLLCCCCYCCCAVNIIAVATF